MESELTVTGQNPPDVDALFVVEYDALRRYAIRRVGLAAADDVVADVFLSVCRRVADVPWDNLSARRVHLDLGRVRNGSLSATARIEFPLDRSVAR